MLGMEEERIIYDSEVFSDIPVNFPLEMLEMGNELRKKFGLAPFIQFENLVETLRNAFSEVIPQEYDVDIEAWGQGYQLLPAIHPFIEHTPTSELILSAASNVDYTDPSSGTALLVAIGRAINTQLYPNQGELTGSRDQIVGQAHQLVRQLEGDTRFRYPILPIAFAGSTASASLPVRYALKQLNPFFTRGRGCALRNRQPEW